MTFADETASPRTVQTTLINVGGANVSAYRLGDLMVLALQGASSPALLLEFEALAKRTGASIGLDLSNLGGIRPSLVPSMEKVRRLLARRGHGFVLLNPPSQVLELLSLAGLLDKYQVDESAPAPAARTEDAAVRLKSFRMTLRQTQEMERNLENAEHRISSFMPQSLPLFPGWRFAAYWRPCNRIGGDFYDFIPLGRDKLGIAVGDVSGHGLPGAVIMGIAKKVLRLRAQESPHQTPAEILAHVNGDLVGDLGKGTFVTVLYGTIDRETGDFVFARAGHEPPLLVARPPARPEFVASRGVALGIVPSKVFRDTLEERTFRLQSGDGVLIFSDGITDAADGRGVRFEKGRLCEALAGERAPQALRVLRAKLAEFTGGAAQSDDMTAVAFGRE